jgi:chromosome segregation ATPase
MTIRFPSSPSLNDDEVATLGEVMAAQAKLSARMSSLESAVNSYRQEHQTSEREAVQLRKDVNELLSQSAATHRQVTIATRAAPPLVFLIEVLRYALDHVQFLGH